MPLRERTLAGKLVSYGELLFAQILFNRLENDLVRTRSWVH